MNGTLNEKLLVIYQCCPVAGWNAHLENLGAFYAEDPALMFHNFLQMHEQLLIEHKNNKENL